MRILIWGTGKKADSLLKNGVNAEIVGFVQTEKGEETYKGYKVYAPGEIDFSYDYIIVATIYADQIRNESQKAGIDDSKMIYLYRRFPKGYGYKINEDIRTILAGKNLTMYCYEYGMQMDAFIADDIKAYTQMNKRESFEIEEDNLWPIITDKYSMAGAVKNYFWQDLWAAKKIISSGVRNHYDIGSRLDGFIAHLLAAQIDVTMIDVREFPAEVEGLSTIVADATLLEQFEDNSIHSLSALCSLEHFGLGRYGDPIDPEACFKCFAAIQKKMAQGGKLYISLPIGRERVEFNAHRVFYPSTIIECFSELELVEFACTSEGTIYYPEDIHEFDNDPHNGEHRYGMFMFVKR